MNNSMSHPVPTRTYEEDAIAFSKKHKMAKKMKPIGEDLHQTFKKFGRVVSKLGSTHKKYGDKPF